VNLLGYWLFIFFIMCLSWFSIAVQHGVRTKDLCGGGSRDYPGVVYRRARSILWWECVSSAAADTPAWRINLRTNRKRKRQHNCKPSRGTGTQSGVCEADQCRQTAAAPGRYWRIVGTLRTVKEEAKKTVFRKPDEADKLALTLDFLIVKPDATDAELAGYLGMKRPASARFWRLKAQMIREQEAQRSEHPAEPGTEPILEEVLCEDDGQMEGVMERRCRHLRKQARKGSPVQPPQTDERGGSSGGAPMFRKASPTSVLRATCSLLRQRQVD